MESYNRITELSWIISKSKKITPFFFWIIQISTKPSRNHRIYTLKPKLSNEISSYFSSPEVLKLVLACSCLLGWQNSKLKAGHRNCLLEKTLSPLVFPRTRGLEVDLTVYDSLIESAARHVFFFFFVVCSITFWIILELEKIEERGLWRSQIRTQVLKQRSCKLEINLDR